MGQTLAWRQDTLKETRCGGQLRCPEVSDPFTIIDIGFRQNRIESPHFFNGTKGDRLDCELALIRNCDPE